MIEEKELTEKLRRVYESLIETNEAEVQELLLKLTPMFQNGDSDEKIIEVAKKILLLRKQVQK